MYTPSTNLGKAIAQNLTIHPDQVTDLYPTIYFKQKADTVGNAATFLQSSEHGVLEVMYNGSTGSFKSSQIITDNFRLDYPSTNPNPGQILKVSPSGDALEWSNDTSGGDVSGPNGSTIHSIPKYDDTTGKLIGTTTMTFDSGNDVFNVNKIKPTSIVDENDSEGTDDQILVKTTTGLEWQTLNIDLSEYNKGPQTLTGVTDATTSMLPGLYNDGSEIKLREVPIYVYASGSTDRKINMGLMEFNSAEFADVIFFNRGQARLNPDSSPKKEWFVEVSQLTGSYMDMFRVASSDAGDHLSVDAQLGNEVRFNHGIVTPILSNNLTGSSGWSVNLVGTTQPTSGQVLGIDANGDATWINQTSPDLSSYVEGPNSSVNNNIALFDGTTGKIIKDSGKSLSDYYEKLTGTTTGSLTYFNDTNGTIDEITSATYDSNNDILNVTNIKPELIVDENNSSGTNGQILARTTTGLEWTNAPTLTGFVEGPNSSTNENLAIFDGTTGKIIKDSTVNISELVTHDNSGVTDRIPIFSSTGELTSDALLSFDTDTLVTAKLKTDDIIDESDASGNVGQILRKTTTGFKWDDEQNLSEYLKGPQTLEGSTSTSFSKLPGLYDDNGEVKVRETGITTLLASGTDEIYFNYDRTRRSDPDDDNTSKRSWSIHVFQPSFTNVDRFSIRSFDNSFHTHLSISTGQGDQVRFPNGIGTRYFGNKFQNSNNSGWEVELVGTSQPTTGQVLGINASGQATWIDVDLSEYNKGPQTLSGTTDTYLSKLPGLYDDNGEVKLRDTGITIHYQPTEDAIYFNYDRTRTNSDPDNTPKRRWRIYVEQPSGPTTYDDRFSINSRVTLPGGGETNRTHLNIPTHLGEQVRFLYGIGTRYFGNRYQLDNNDGWEVELVGTSQPTKGQMLQVVDDTSGPKVSWVQAPIPVFQIANEFFGITHNSRLSLSLGVDTRNNYDYSNGDLDTTNNYYIPSESGLYQFSVFISVEIPIMVGIDPPRQPVALRCYLTIGTSNNLIYSHHMIYDNKGDTSEPNRYVTSFTKTMNLIAGDLVNLKLRWIQSASDDTNYYDLAYCLLTFSCLRLG